MGRLTTKITRQKATKATQPIRTRIRKPPDKRVPASLGGSVLTAVGVAAEAGFMPPLLVRSSRAHLSRCVFDFHYMQLRCFCTSPCSGGQTDPDLTLCTRLCGHTSRTSF